MKILSEWAKTAQVSWNFVFQKFSSLVVNIWSKFDRSIQTFLMKSLKLGQLICIPYTVNRATNGFILVK